MRDVFSIDLPLEGKSILLSCHSLSIIAHHILFLETTFAEIMNIKKLTIFHATEVITTGIYIKSFTNQLTNLNNDATKSKVKQ